jgi:hypothetical protein
MQWILILTLLMTAGTAQAVCTATGPDTWHCADTGSPATNGTDLRAFLDSQPFACGDKIVLEAGVEYRMPEPTPEPYFPLKPQLNCEGKMTDIRSSRLEEIPFGAKKDLVEYRSMMPTLSTANNTVFRLMSDATNKRGTNNYKFSGLRIATTEWAHVNRATVSSLMFHPNFDWIWWAGCTPNNSCSDDNIRYYGVQKLEVDRCLLEEWEEQVYGDPNPSNTQGDAFLRSVYLGINLPPGDDFFIHDSYMKFVGYKQATPWASIASATESKPTVLSGTNLQALLGISYKPGCTSACVGYADGGACNGACARVVLRGGTGNWVSLNGPKYARARSDGNLDLVVPDPDFSHYGSPTYYDGTGKGALTGTVEIAKANLQSQIAILSQMSTNVRVIDNHIEGWGITMFLGGGDGAPIDPAIVQGGSTITSWVLDHVRELKVGDIISAYAPAGAGKSIYCTVSGGCQGSLTRAGRVTAIVGTTVTVEPWGPDGVDVAPKTGGQAIWRNHITKGLQVRGNNISRSPGHQNADAGKGPFENKSCVDCIVDGNVMNGNLNADGSISATTTGNYFITARNQGGRSPSSRVHNFRYSNNLASGTSPSGVPNCIWRMTLNPMDTEFSNTRGQNVWYEHNLHVGCRAPATGTSQHVELGGVLNSGYRHNTVAVGMAQPNFYRMIFAGDCNRFTPQPEWGQNRNGTVQDNILSFGDTSYGGVPSATICWPTMSNDVKTNIMVDTESLGASAINAMFPGNYPVANYDGFWAGTCDHTNWGDCRLAATNPNRGRASDGGDPGADVEQIRDRVHRWSEKAGLLEVDIGTQTMRAHRDAFKIGSTRAALMFATYDEPAGACTLELFTDRNRATLHGDTDEVSEQSCAREGNVQEGNTATFVLGSNEALTPNTTYYYRIKDGQRTMVGEFTTFGLEGATTQWGIQLPTADTVTYSTNADLSGGTTLAAASQHRLPLAANSVMYWRVGLAGMRSVFVAP